MRIGFKAGPGYATGYLCGPSAACETAEPDNPEIRLTKSASPQTYTNAGQTITYTFTVENTGNVTLYDITIDDNLVTVPGTLAELAPGEIDDATFSAVYTITSDDMQAEWVDNHAIVTGSDEDGTEVQDDDNERIERDIDILRVRPILECVQDNGDGTYTAHFGYLNENPFEVTVALGDDNMFIGGAPDRDPPTVFQPGRTEYWPDAGFSVTFNGDNLVWRLQGRTSTASSGSSVCAYYIFLDKEWQDENGNPLAEPPADLPADYAILAFSSLGTATGTYAPGSDTLSVSYSGGGNGLRVPVGETYTVAEVNLPGGWDRHAGVGEFGVDEYGVPGHQGLDKYILHTVVNRQLPDQTPAISLIKTADPVTYQAVDDVITYTFTVENTGNVTLYDVTLDDVLVNVIGGPIAEMAPGAVDSSTFSATYTITHADMIAGQVDNTATVTGKDSEDTPVSDTDDATVTRNGPAPEWGSLGDFVWLDENSNGIQDVGEPGVPGVVVQLFSESGDLLEETVTDGTGFYLFEYLVGGTYYVQFVLPTGHVFTQQGAGTDPAVDSDANVLTGKTGPVVLLPAEDRRDIDAGLVSSEAEITLLKEGVFVPGTLDPWENCDVFGLAALFNAVIFGDLTVTGGDTEGRLAVGGNFEYIQSGYSVGLVITGLPMPTYYGGQTDSFIVGGDLIDGVFAVNGNVVYGGERSGNQRFMVDGNVLRQQNPITLDAHGNVPADGSGITFDEMHDRLLARSQELAALPERGVVEKELEPWGDLSLVGDDPALNIFEVPATNWTRSILITVPEGATVLVNVVGDTVDMRNGSMILEGLTAEDLLVNFVDATEFSMAGYLHEGSVLAPLANAYFNGGAINGRVVFGGNVEKEVGSEFHNYFFNGELCLEDQEAAPQPPAIHYTFTVTNSGNVPLENITIDDPLVEVLGGPLATLAAGETDDTTFSAILELSESDLATDEIVNTATVSAYTVGGQAVTATDDVTVSGFGWPTPVINTNALQSVGGVDFVVQSVELNPVPSMLGTRFRVQVQVRNDGEAAGIPQAVAVWANLNQWEATPAGAADLIMADADPLLPGETRTYAFEEDIMAANVEGTYHLIARVDPENLTDEWSTGNNFGGATYTLEEVDVDFIPNPDGAGMLLQWNSVAGYYYFVDRAEGLTGEAPFVDIADNLDATPPVNSYVDENPPTSGVVFYRVWGYKP
jgi:choice-of-anchor A domain-containing protein/uncharacterized repeat protein (TIGR01451 family)